MLVGKTINDIDPTQLNVPLRNVKVNTDLKGIQRVEPNPIETVGRLQPSQAAPATPITLSDWIQAQGTAVITCKQDDAKVQLSLTGLLPNRIYSVWGLFGGDNISPFPLGGVPNTVVTNGRGRASFIRELNFCPMDSVRGQRPLIAIDIVYHSDHQNYGMVPELDLAGLVTGTVTHTQLEFLVKGEEVP